MISEIYSKMYPSQCAYSPQWVRNSAVHRMVRNPTNWNSQGWKIVKKISEPVTKEDI